MHSLGNASFLKKLYLSQENKGLGNVIVKDMEQKNKEIGLVSTEAFQQLGSVHKYVFFFIVRESSDR